MTPFPLQRHCQYPVGQPRPPRPRPACGGLLARAAPLLSAAALLRAAAAEKDDSSWDLSQELAGVGGRRLQTSTECRQRLNDVVTSENWQFWNRSERHWCRLRLENEFAQCCTIADFNKGTAEGCSTSGCFADCRHTQLMQQCGYYGQACLVRRKPFVRTGIYSDNRPSDAEHLEVQETFCVPDACNNGPDREALMAWFKDRYRDLRYGWTANYDDATLECDNGVVMILLVTLLCIVVVVCCAGICVRLFVAPAKRGRTLVSQEDMNKGTSADAVEPMDDSFRPTRDLRAAGQGERLALGAPQGTY